MWAAAAIWMEIARVGETPGSGTSWFPGSGLSSSPVAAQRPILRLATTVKVAARPAAAAARPGPAQAWPSPIGDRCHGYAAASSQIA